MSPPRRIIIAKKNQEPHHQLFLQGPAVQPDIEIIRASDPDRFHHLAVVSRLKVGELLSIVFEPVVYAFEFKVKAIGKNAITLCYTGVSQMGLAHQIKRIALCPAIDFMRLSWAIEKLTELGCDAFYLFQSRFTQGQWVKKLSGSQGEKNLNKLQTLAHLAAEQSEQFRIPVLHNALLSLDQLSSPLLQEANNSLKLVLLERESGLRSLKEELRTYLNLKPEAQPADIIFAVGPEGGWHADDVKLLKQNEFVGVCLASNAFSPILRTETALVYAASVVLSAN